MKRIITATITAALLTIAATTAQAAVQNWEEEARYFSMLFASNSTVVVQNYFEDGSFVIEDEFGHTYKGCQLHMPCDDSVTITTNVYLPTVSK